MFTVIIPTFNRNEDLQQCLESLKKNTSINHEVIVLAPDISGEIDVICKRYEAKLLLDGSRKNGVRVKSLWGILNYGIELSTYDWVVWLNDDCLVEPNWDIESFKEISESTVLFILKTSGIGNIKEFRIGYTSKFEVPCANYAFLKKSSRLRFDEKFNWFHGDADISIQAYSQAYEVLTGNFDAVVHNHKQDDNRKNNEQDPRVRMDDDLLESKWRFWIRSKNRIRPATRVEALKIIVNSVIRKLSSKVKLQLIKIKKWATK